LIPTKGFVYHLVPPEVWEKALIEGHYRPASLKTEGFVHLSTEDQVPESAQIHLGSHPELVVLRLPIKWIKDKLKWEEGRNEELFPHLYGPLKLHFVETTLALERHDDGTFHWQS